MNSPLPYGVPLLPNSFCVQYSFNRMDANHVTTRSLDLTNVVSDFSGGNETDEYKMFKLF